MWTDLAGTPAALYRLASWRSNAAKTTHALLCTVAPSCSGPATDVCTHQAIAELAAVVAGGLAKLLCSSAVEQATVLCVQKINFR